MCRTMTLGDPDALADSLDSTSHQSATSTQYSAVNSPAGGESNYSYVGYELISHFFGLESYLLF